VNEAHPCKWNGLLSSLPYISEPAYAGLSETSKEMQITKIASGTKMFPMHFFVVLRARDDDYAGILNPMYTSGFCRCSRNN
jgi:hypothetical protein